jgi:hypothetical protein
MHAPQLLASWQQQANRRELDHVEYVVYTSWLCQNLYVMAQRAQKTGGFGAPPDDSAARAKNRQRSSCSPLLHQEVLGSLPERSS